MFGRILNFSALALVLLAFCSCEKEKDIDFEGAFGGGEITDNPQEGPQGKRCFIWIEGNANFRDYGDSRENIARDMAKISDCGFTDIVVDVRPAGAGGDVLFKTDKCPQVDFMGAWVNGSYVKVQRTSDWDYLQAFIDQAHKVGLRVYAGFNTFCGGHESGLGKNGVLFRDYITLNVPPRAFSNVPLQIWSL